MSESNPEPKLRKQYSAKAKPGYTEVFTPFIVVKGKVIYPKHAKVFHFWVKA